MLVIQMKRMAATTTTIIIIMTHHLQWRYQERSIPLPTVSFKPPTTIVIIPLLVVVKVLVTLLGEGWVTPCSSPHLILLLLINLKATTQLQSAL
jgi:hypothetical protein